MPRVVLSAVVCDGKNFDFYYECYVCNVSVERNLNHFIVYLITYANLCCVFSARWCYASGCTMSNRDRAGVLFRFPKDTTRYVRYVM